MKLRTMYVLLAMMLVVAAICSTRANATPAPPASPRVVINLSQGVPNFVATSGGTALPQSQWWYENNEDSSTFAATSYAEVAAPAADLGPACGGTLTTPDWTHVGVPNDANIWRTFINQASGGGQGSLCGQNNWYRLHFKVASAYASSKIEVELEGAHTGVQIYINGTLLKGISAVAADANASHVVGFIPVIADLTPYIHADGATDNVLAISVSRGNTWYEDPDFSEVFRYGQAMAGLFRPVKMFITNQVHIPVNVYSNQKTWGTYVATVSEVPSTTNTAQAASAVIQIEANVLNETTTAQTVVLTNQIVDENGNVVATGAAQSLSINPMTAGNFPSSATPEFSQQITLTNPWLWYPNNSPYGTPYLYTVNHIVTVNGTVVDVAQSPLGIRTITWNANFPIINGYPMNLWGGSGRYDYPGLGSSVPEEQQWRDLALIAAEGGNIWRPGHSTSSEEFVAAADEYGIFVDQPSGDNEEAFTAASADSIQLKEELHRDMILRDRSHPSILDWESNNGTMTEAVGTALLALNSEWDPINTRVAADRTPDPVNGTLLGCTLEGCEVGIKSSYPNNPAWGAEYWGTGTARGLAWNFELAFIAPFMDNWQKSKAANCMGMAQWYLTDTPGETGQFIEAGSSTTAPGNANAVRSLGASSMDQNRFPKLLYYSYEAAWTPYSIKPVVRLASHWNQSGTVQVNAFSNCPAVKLLLNGVQQGSIETPNPWDSNDEANQTQTATGIPFQAYWNVPWATGTITAECLNAAGNVVASDSRTTAGAENKIVLTVTPELTRPDGTNYQVSANGSDAAFVTATIEDANGNWEPLASDTLTFSVSGPATYQGGTQQYVSTNTDAYSSANTSYVNGVPDAFYEAPGDPQLSVEGGLTRIALRSQFTTGTVTVTATAPGLATGTATFNIVAVPDPRTAPTNICSSVASAPGGLGATAVTANSISLTWNAVSAPTNCAINEYNVYRSTASGFTPSTSNLVAPNVQNTSYDDDSAGLAGKTTYYYAVAAVDSYGTSAGSAQASVTTPAGNIPPIPAGLAASYGNGRVSLNWTASSGATSYNIYRGTATGGESATAYATGDTSPTYIDTAVTNGITYYYTVAAVNANGTSNKSYEVNATPSSSADVIAINCGGAATGTWLADTDFSGGSADVTTNTISTAGISNPAPVNVYQTNRYGTFTYTVGSLSANTSYTVRLHFCETYFTAAGDRTFDVSINGTQVLTNFDIYATAGAENQAVVEQYTETTNASGQFVIVITSVINNGQINGIEVLGSGGSCTSVPPTGPSSLTATAASSSSINLSWATGFANPPCIVTSYDVFRGTTNGFTPSSSNMVANVNATTYTDTGLAASTTYYYVVETLDSYGASSASGQAQATTSGSGGPGTPSGLTANAGNAQIALSWTAGSGATSYNIYRGTATGGESATAIATAVTTLTYTNTGLTNGSAYYYKVASVNASGTSGQSNEASGTPSSGGTGSMVLGINCGSTATGSWVADEDFSGGTANSTANTIDTTAVTNPAPVLVYDTNRFGTCTYTIGGLTANSSYTVRLHFCETYWTAAGKRTFNVSINSTQVLTNFDIFATSGAENKANVQQFTATANASGQIVITFTTVIDNAQINGIEIDGSTGGSAPPAPTGLASTAGNAQIALNWTASSGATSYNVYRGTAAGGESATAIATGDTTASYTNTGLTNGTAYYYKVAAINSYGTSGQSNEASATPTTGGPGAPSGLTATAGNAQVALSWTAGSGASTYNLYRGTAAGGENSVPVFTGISSTSYTNTGLTNGTKYYFTVKSVNSVGTSGASNEVSATPSGTLAPVIQINCGGTAASPFVADTDFSGGTEVTSTNTVTTTAVTNPAPEAVYQTNRYGAMSYTIGGLTANASYTVRLHFAETYWTAKGDREFNVSINSTQVLTDFDIFATAGGENIANIQQFTTTSNASGQIVIGFTTVIDNAQINGIEIEH